MTEEDAREVITLEEGRALTVILAVPVTLTRPETDAADTLVD